MPKISLAGFKDPVRRPRYIIWTVVAVLVIITVMIPVLGATSTRWFCINGCHKVQDDTIESYAHSTHNRISCMACHMPVNANPIIFLMHKAEALGELAQTVTNNYELPLNAEDEVALTMKSEQCTQCHNIETRVITPSPGIKINHAAHISRGVTCTICHNRVAHNEDFTLTLKDPKTGKPNQKHPNFMNMTACFRCHGQEAGAPAPGTCSACHTPGFQLKPASHFDPNFFPKGHAELAKSAEETVTETLKETGQSVVTGQRKGQFEAASRQAGQKGAKTVGQLLPPVGAIFYCGTCHKDQFCLDCHGTPMPHSDEFKNPTNVSDPKGHPVISTQIPDKCVMCHTKDDPNFCNKCHHGTQVNWTFNPAVPWLNQHPQAVAKSGVKVCQKCHTATFCSDCHTKNHVFPASHRQPTWLRSPIPSVTVFGSQPASATALHAQAALESTETCAVCHGEGGANAPFCAACHKKEMPHPSDFKTQKGVHGTEGQKNPAVCRNCHTWPELCSNCHHVGSSFSQPWLAVHGGSVEKNGTGTCFQCHPQTGFCQPCHQSRKIIPPSHKSNTFVKAPGATLGQHAQLYQKDNAICTYCHPLGTAQTLPNSDFCKGCHKVDMPHPEGFGKTNSEPANGKNGGQHTQLLSSGQVSEAVCMNCHETAFCDSCHHAQSVPTVPWIKYHPNVVKAKGATGCFDCHQETFCSDCHVNLAKRGLLK